MDIYWKVPLRIYPDVCGLLWECAQAERVGDTNTANELKEQIRLLPGYPIDYNPDYDTIVVVPRDARITIEALHSYTQPSGRFALAKPNN